MTTYYTHALDTPEHEAARTHRGTDPYLAALRAGGPTKRRTP